MATINMRQVNFWLLPDFCPNMKRTASQKHHCGPAAAATSQNQAVLLYNKAGFRLQNSSKSKSKTAVVTEQHEFPLHSEGQSVNARGMWEGEHFLQDPI
jgi:hypothetical protein